MSGSTTGSMNCLYDTTPFPSVTTSRRKQTAIPSYSTIFFFLLSHFSENKLQQKKLHRVEKETAPLFIGKEPGPLHGLSGPDGKAIIGNEEEEKKNM